jgi:hypothetical protein
MLYATLDGQCYEFTTERLHAAFLRAYRQAVPIILPAAHTEVREGAWDAWLQLAHERVDAEPQLCPHRDLLFSDWVETDHSRWVATQPLEKILAWCDDHRND